MRIGETIDGRYVLKKFIGEGATGAVYLAEDLKEHERIALKALKREMIDEDGLNRFKSEFNSIAGIDHPNTIRVFELGDNYFTMEYIDGRPLDASQKRPVAEVLRIGAEICRALNFIHRNGLIHGDLKPAHVLITSRPQSSDAGQPEEAAAPRTTSRKGLPPEEADAPSPHTSDGRVKLIDFGLSRAMPSAVTLTKEDVEIEGTVEYMPPEHIRGLGKDARSDLYSLGVILYEMLTGRLPFEGSDFLSIALGHLNVQPEPPSKIEPKIPPPLEALVLRLLHKNPEQRYQSAEEAGRRLVEMLGGKEARETEVMKGRQFLFSPTFVGREGEMKTVETYYQKALGGAGFCVLVHGEAGLGKTRLLREFRAKHLLDDVIFLSGLCSTSPGARNTYYAELMSQAIQVLRRFDEKLLGEKLWEWSINLTRLSPSADPDWFFRNLDQIVAAEPALFLRNMCDLLLTLVRLRPLAISVDNLHLADRFSAELFARIVRTAAGARIFVLGAYRDAPGGRETPFSRIINRLDVGKMYADLRLKPMPRKELDHLVSSMMGHSAVARAMSKEIATVTGGNPLFAEEMVKAFADQGIIVKVGPQWKSDEQKLADYRMPETLGEVILERAAKVGPRHVQILGAAAVIGSGIDSSRLHSLTKMPHLDLYYILGDIVSQGILTETDRPLTGSVGPASHIYNFTGDSVREHFYNQLDDKTRRRYHEQLARHLEATHAETRDTILDALIHHYAGCNNRSRLFRSLVRAGELAEMEGSHERALDYWHRALELFDKDEEKSRKAAILADMARASVSLGDTRTAREYLDRAAEICPRECPERAALKRENGRLYFLRGDLELALEEYRSASEMLKRRNSKDAKLLIYLGEHALANDLHDTAAAYLSQAVAPAREGEDRGAPAQADVLLAKLLVRQGKYADAVKQLNSALSAGEHLNNPALRTIALSGLVAAYIRAGKMERAHACLLQAEENAAQCNDRFALVDLRLAQAQYNLAIGSLDVATESAESAMSLARQAKFRSRALDAQALLGALAIKRDDLRHGIELCQRALSTARTLNSKHRMAGIACVMGEAYMARGEYDTALEFLGHSRRIYERLGLEAELSRIFFLLGELYYRRRDLFSARQFLTRTLENATLQDDWLLMGESHRVMARVFLEEDDSESAKASFGQAVEILQKHGNPVVLARACQDYALFLAESEHVEQQQEGLGLLEQAFSLYSKAGADFLARKADVMVKKFRRRYRDQTLTQREEVSFDGLGSLRQEIGRKFQELLREAEANMSTEGFSDRLLEEVQSRIQQAQNELYGQIDNLSQQNHRLQQDIDFLMEEKNNLSILQEVSKTINSELDLNRLISKILDMVIEVLQAERGFLILRDKDGTLLIRTARNIDKDTVKKPEFKLSFSIAKRVVKTGEAILTSNAQEDSRFKDKISVLDLKLKSVLCVPFKLKDQILGAVYVDNRFVSGLFSEKDLELLTALGNQASIALENARLYEENLKKQKEMEHLNRRLQQQVSVQRDELDKSRSVLEDSRRQLALKYDYSNIIGKSRAMQDVFHLVDRIIETRVSVLIQGGSGTGKELVARAIHYNGPLKDKPFAAENCAALPESLLESELFGYKKGAFTGADRDKKGLFEIANGGTLFLDEVGEMSENMQKKLLRVLQEGEIRPVGDKEYKKVSVRLLSATNKDLKKQMEKGRFREDLYYRINVVTINLPPLRDRREDIPLLVNFFLDKIAKESGQPRKEITPGVITLLERYSWPGNVRELENEISRLVALSPGQTMRQDTLSTNIQMLQHSTIAPDADSVRLRARSLKEVERETIINALRATNGNKVEAARALQIDRTTLYNKMKRYGILE